jgi:hypothetical protein
VVTLSYLRLLDKFGGSLEYAHTATWVPPYVGAGESPQQVRLHEAGGWLRSGT